MSDDDDTHAKERARGEKQEAALVYNRIRELRLDPIRGTFDVVHLKAIHAYIFQDLPHHKPGIIRGDSRNWTKHRALEGRPRVLDVPYLSYNVDNRIEIILEKFRGPATIKGLTPRSAAAHLAELYGDLDHAHGFYEGNSRTLREFPRQLAAKAEFSLDWIKTVVGAKERNELYLARDLAVFERAFPGLTEEKAMRTNDRREYEAYFTVEYLRKAVGDRTLDAIIHDKLDPASAGGVAGSPRRP